MKKRSQSLTLTTHTIRVLTDAQLTAAIGGLAEPSAAGEPGGGDPGSPGGGAPGTPRLPPRTHH